MQILSDFGNQDDLELILYSMILINTVLNAIPDQDTFYDVSDAYEEQGMQRIIQHYLKSSNSKDDNHMKQIIQQMELYEAALQQEDGEEIHGNDDVNSSLSSNSTNSMNTKSSYTNKNQTSYSTSNGTNSSLAPNLRFLN